MTLYELTEEFLQLLELAEDPETDPQVFEDTMESVGAEWVSKAEGYVKVIKQIEADAAAIKAEEKRLSERRKAAEKNADRIKQTLKAAMEVTGNTKIKTELFTVSVRKNPESVVIDTEDMNDIPGQFFVYTKTINKTELKRALKDGEDLTGVAHLESGTSLSIK